MRIYVVKHNRLGIALFGIIMVLGLAFVSHKFISSMPVLASGPISQVETDEKVMALTINVDWGEENIPAMLEALKKEGVKATFFISGRWAKNNPELVKKIAAEGHLVENHAYSHLHPDKISVDDNKRELLRTEQVLENLIGRKTGFYAPPYGEKGTNGLRAARELGYTTILWTIDTIDWREDSTVELIVQRVLNPAVKFGVKPEKKGAIILMHPKANTVRALPMMIGALKQEGFRFATVIDLLEIRKK